MLTKTIRQQAFTYTSKLLGYDKIVQETEFGPTKEFDWVVKGYLAGRKNGIKHTKETISKNLKERRLR